MNAEYQRLVLDSLVALHSYVLPWILIQLVFQHIEWSCTTAASASTTSTVDGFKFNLDIVGDIYPSNPSSMNFDEVEFYSKEFHGVVNFHGFIDKLDDYYKKADLLLLPSKHEGFPVVVMEANSFGVPALTYDVIGCRDAVENNLNGFLVNYGDLSEFTEVIKSRRYMNLKTSSFDYAIKNFDINIKTDLMLQHMNL